MNFAERLSELQGLEAIDYVHDFFVKGCVDGRFQECDDALASMIECDRVLVVMTLVCTLQWKDKLPNRKLLVDIALQYDEEPRNKAYIERLV